MDSLAPETMSAEYPAWIDKKSHGVAPTSPTA